MKSEQLLVRFHSSLSTFFSNYNYRFHPSMLDELRTHLEQELRLPEIRGERCVHAHIETASCRACVESCPLQAWHLDDDRLGIDTETCDGCGLCAPACSEGAILHAHEPLLRQLNQHVVALAACEKTELTGQGVMPCIHALGLHDLLKLYRQGVRAMIVSSADCAQCSRHQTPVNLPKALNALNSVLTQRGHSVIVFRELAAENWQNQRQNMKLPVSEEQLSRRHFLRQGLQTAVQEGLKWQGLLPQDRDHFPPPATLLPSTKTPSKLPYVPQIDPTRCDGCDACFNLCPHEALRLDTEKAQYVIAAERCTGCRICSDVCEPQAISVTHWIIPSITYLSLHHAHCRRCGAPFHRPVEYQTEKDICHICSKVNHQRNLFQVLD